MVLETLTPTAGVDYADNEEKLQMMTEAFRTILKVESLYSMSSM